MTTVSAARIANRVKALGRQISRDAGGRRLDVVVTMDRAFMFAADLIRAIDGPLFITSCSAATEDCEQSDRCTIREPLRRVGRSIEQVLNRLTIWEMTEPEHEAAPELVHLGWTASKADQV